MLLFRGFNALWTLLFLNYLYDTHSRLHNYWGYIHFYHWFIFKYVFFKKLFTPHDINYVVGCMI